MTRSYVLLTPSGGVLGVFSTLLAARAARDRAGASYGAPARILSSRTNRLVTRRMTLRREGQPPEHQLVEAHEVR